MGEEVRDQAPAEAQEALVALCAAIDRNTHALGLRSSFVRGGVAALGGLIATLSLGGLVAGILRAIGIL